MNPSDCGDLLRACAFYDNRHVTTEAMIAWSHAIGPDVTKVDALRAIAEHHATSTDYIGPAHINLRVREVRRVRLQDAGTPPIPGDLTWAQEKAWRTLWCAGVKDGQSSEDAAASASEAMSLPRELPPGSSDQVAAERLAFVAKLAESKATPKASPEKVKRPRTRWGDWSRGDLDDQGNIVFVPDGPVLYHELGPYGIALDQLRTDLEFWLDHMQGKGCEPTCLIALTEAHIHIFDTAPDVAHSALDRVRHQRASGPTEGAHRG